MHFVQAKTLESLYTCDTKANYKWGCSTQTRGAKLPRKSGVPRGWDHDDGCIFFPKNALAIDDYLSSFEDNIPCYFPETTTAFTPISRSILAAVATPFTLSDDEAQMRSLNFSFPFYDTESSSVFISNNGMLGINSISQTAINQPLPDEFLGASIFPYWDDLLATQGSLWFFQGNFNSNNDATKAIKFVMIRWDDLAHFFPGPNVSGVTFSVYLYETGHIYFHLEDLDFANQDYNNGASATIGIQAGDGKRYKQLSYNLPNANLPGIYCFEPVENGDSVLDFLPAIFPAIQKKKSNQ